MRYQQLVRSWWGIGEGSGKWGKDLSLGLLACPFCTESGNWERVHRETKQKPNANKVLYFDTYKCGNCANFTMVFWSPSSSYGSDIHDYKQVPWPRCKITSPDHWPSEVGRFWVQAHDNVTNENWDAASVMARSALQAALREQKATGSTLNDEIDDLATKGLIPPVMKSWAHNLRLEGNKSAHPRPGGDAIAPADVQDLVNFLDFFFEYLYDLPERIKQFTARREAHGAAGV